MRGGEGEVFLEELQLYFQHDVQAQRNGVNEPIADEVANEENVPTHSNDPLLSGEDSLKLNDLMEIYTKLQQRVLDLENTKTAQVQEISSLKWRVKRLEKKRGSRTHKLKKLFKVGRSAQVVSSKRKRLLWLMRRRGDMVCDLVFDTSVFYGEEVFAGQDVVEKEVSTADPVTTAGEVVTTASVEVSAATTTTTTTITEVDLTFGSGLLAANEECQTKETLVISTTRTTLTQIPSNIKDKGKAKMIEPEKPLKKTEQIRLDEELAFKLQAKEAKQARLAREKEQEELIDEEKARLFIELLEKRKKHFAALRAQEKKNKPPTKEQKKSTMSTYLKHMAGYKQSQLKNKSFA
ncbi:hypothetical protein Tco_1403483 [Tanacetum coccineum]